MRCFASLLLLIVLCSGCRSDRSLADNDSREIFAPTAMRIHPIFTQVKDWTGDGKPDGIEALIEFQDQFGDPTKARGRAIFELFEYRAASPDPRGERLFNPWVGSLVPVDEQRARWNRTTQTYSFQLSADDLNRRRAYVLTIIFERMGGGRFFDRIIIEPSARAEEDDEPRAVRRDPAPPDLGNETPPPDETNQPPARPPAP